MSKFAKVNGIRLTKFDLAQWLNMRSGIRRYINPHHFTYAELLELCLKKGLKVD